MSGCCMKMPGGCCRACPTPASQRIYLLFPDPWPKRRHKERRFTGRANLDALARVMADGAELRIASDDMGYIRWTLENSRLHPDLAWLARRPQDWRQPPADWIADPLSGESHQGRPEPHISCFSAASARLNCP